MVTDPKINAPTALPGVGLATHLIHNNDEEIHSHDYYEIFYILSGSIYHLLNFKETLLETGDCVVLRLSDIHSFRRVGECIHRDIMITKELFDSICNFTPPIKNAVNFSPQNPTFKFSITELAELEQNLIYFLSESDIERKRSWGILVTYRILSKLMEPKISNENIPPLLKIIIADISKRDFLHEGIPLIVKVTGYNHAYLCRYFKKHMGVTLTEYLNEIRLSWAAYYLRNSNMLISEICEAIGLESVAYFNSIFKKKYGYTPSKYKEISN